MKEFEKDIFCVLLQTLRNKKLIGEKIHDQAKTKILDTLDEKTYFCYAKEKREEAVNGSS